MLAPAILRAGSEDVPGQVIVKFKDPLLSHSQKDQILGSMAIRVHHFTKGPGAAFHALGTSSSFYDSIVHVVLKPGVDNATAIAQLSQDPRIEYVHSDHYVHAFAIPNDPSFPIQWGLHNTGQAEPQGAGTVHADIHAPLTWDMTTGSTNVIVAVIDTGIDYTHPDLQNNMWVNAGEIPNNGIDDEGDGFVDDVYGVNFSTSPNTGDPMDDNGHGTHVAGIIGMEGNNNTGATGVNWHVRLMALKFLDKNGQGQTSDAIQAFIYAQAHGVKVINCSWGGTTFDQGLQDAITNAHNAGIVVVAAAGNNNSGNCHDRTLYYPANMNHVIAVAATNNKDTKACFSVEGTGISMGAPGVDIYSTFASTPSSPNYQYLDGTSQAAPHVAGVAALIFSVAPTLTPAQVRLAMENNVDVPAGWDTVHWGHGRLDAFQAVRSVFDTTPPTVQITAPTTGSTVSGTVTVTATASDDHAIGRVEFEIDGVLKATVSTAPYQFNWDTTLYTNATHHVKATAFDIATNTAISTVAVTVLNGSPTVAFTNPLDSQVLSGTVNATATASGTGGIRRVEFYLDGTLIKTATTAPYGFTLDTKPSANGPHTLLAKAFDGVGNNNSASINVTFSNDVTPPSVSFLSPANNGTVSGNFAISIQATDDVGVTRVELYLDNNLMSTLTAQPYNFSLNATGLANGSHVLLAKGYDAAGNIGSASITVTLAPASTGVSAFNNLFNPARSEQVQMSYTMATQDHVLIQVYDRDGADIRRLFDQDQAPGSYTVSWDGRNNEGSTVASGMYVVYLQLGGHHETRKVIVVK